MSNTLSKLFIFAAGATVGSVVTLCLVRAKYEKRTLDEIRSIREMYEKDEADEIDDPDILDEETQGLLSEERRAEYNKIVQKYNPESKGVSKNIEVDEDEEEEEDEEDMKPYVISPDEFDEKGYDTVSLYYFEDGVITYAYSGDIMEEDEIDDIIGEDAPNHFGEYEEDTVYIRNDAIMTDFELCRDRRKYSEVE